ncbi:exosortase [Rheinheimera baltica]|uniref:exosortase n=1 Tax=Rheinheimera baltica TaxID=67576 RepID=UPI0027400154|nr:exosortase [Rheinheimera baltica]MDP5148783.1 exosortase [Rheinheimera baltica]
MTIKHANTLFLLQIILLVCSLLLYPQIVVDWRTYSFDDGTYSHAYLMPFIIITLLWQQRNNVQLRFNLLFLAATLGLALVLAVSITSQLISLTRLIFPMYVILLFCSLVKPSKGLIVPLALLWFISPVWGSLIGPLQYIAVVITTFFMQLTHIPVYVEGNFVQIPQGVFEIAEGCSGLRYFIVSLALSTLLCHLQLRKVKNMLLVTLCAIFGAILVNGIRIVMIILIGYYSDMQSSIVKDHNMFGWFLYIPFIMALFYLVGKLEPQPTDDNNAYKPQQLSARSSIVVMFMVVACSGLSLRALTNQHPLFSYTPITITPEASSMQPSAYIAAYSNKTLQHLTVNDHEIINIRFEFNGQHEANRPDYYLNEVIPKGWNKVNSDLTDTSRLVRLTNLAGEHAILQYWYEANGNSTGSLAVYKRYRIHQAFKLNAYSAMQWQFVLCQTTLCTDEATILTMLTTKNHSGQ